MRCDPQENNPPRKRRAATMTERKVDTWTVCAEGQDRVGGSAYAPSLSESGPRHWFPVPDSLTPAQRFRLVEIAHETTEPQVRAAVLGLLGEQS